MEHIRSQYNIAPIHRSTSEPSIAANDKLNITPVDAESLPAAQTAPAIQRAYSLSDIPDNLIHLNAVTATSQALVPHIENSTLANKSGISGAIMGTLAFGTRSLVSGAQLSFNAAKTSLGALNSVRKGISTYIANHQCADTHELLQLQERFKQFEDQKSASICNTLEMRSTTTQNQMIQLEKLTPAISKLPEIQSAFAKCTQELTQHMQWGRAVRKLETQAHREVSELIARPLVGQTTKAQTSLEVMEADLNGVADTLNANEQEFTTTIQDIRNVTELAQSLEINRSQVKTLSSALHLNTRWSDWSACFRALSDYCVQTEKPIEETLDSQAQVAKTLSTALQDLVALKKDVQQLAPSNSLLGEKLAALSKQSKIANADKTLTQSQLQRTQKLFQDIEKKMASATALAQNTVSFFNRQPTQSMQKYTLEFATQLEKTIQQLRSSTVTLTEGHIQNYRLSTQAMGELLQDQDLIEAVAL